MPEILDAMEMEAPSDVVDICKLFSDLKHKVCFAY